MKRKYAKPSISIDIFEANEYIATCIYAKCNVDVNGSHHNYKKNIMYIERNGEDGYQFDGDDRKFTTNHACNKPFTGKLSDLKPYMYDSNGKKSGGNIYSVYYWEVPGNHHVTTGYKETGSSTA